MPLRVYLQDGTGAMVEVTDALEVTSLSVTENAEEGSVAISTVVLDDPDMNIVPIAHRIIEIAEDEVYGTEPAILRGYIGDVSYSRGQYPLGRQVSIQAADANTIWQRRVMMGADCNRPAETDVERMQWLITTSEAGTIDDDTYLSTANPVNMDAADYRTQMMGAVADDCAQASGKNWWISYDSVAGAGYQVWYGHQALEVYDSPLRLSNVLEDVDDVTTFAISDDTTLVSDASRWYTGVCVPYEGGAVYRKSGVSPRRDTVMPSLNVKSRTKAIARAERYLDDFDEIVDRITTAVILPAALVNEIRPGMRVQFRASHLPAYGVDWRWLRVLTRTVAYWAPGQYRLELVLDGPGEIAGTPAEPGVSCGIAEVDAWEVDVPDYHSGGPHSSLSTGPTFLLDNGVYRVVVRCNAVYRAAERILEYFRAGISTTLVLGTGYYLTPTDNFSQGYWMLEEDFGVGVYYSDWVTVSGIAEPTLAWLGMVVLTSGGPGNANFDVWVECM